MNKVAAVIIQAVVREDEKLSTPQFSGRLPGLRNTNSQPARESLAKLQISPLSKFSGQGSGKHQAFPRLAQGTCFGNGYGRHLSLEAPVLEVWEIELDEMQSKAEELTWEAFTKCLTSYFGSQTAGSNRLKFDRCFQKLV